MSDYSDSEKIKESYANWEGLCDDITPIPHHQTDDDPFPVAFKPEYEKLNGTLHALMEAGEHSERAVKVANAVILEVTSRYIAWGYKFEILADIGYDFATEIQIINYILNSNPKCYQAWFYRRWLVDRESTAPDEISYIRDILSNDQKNFHAWSYIIWFGERWSKSREVYDLACSFLSTDCRNNSAWNVRRTAGQACGVDASREFQDVTEVLRKVSQNEGACNFLFALLDDDATLQPAVRELANELIEKNPKNRYALMLLLKVTGDRTEIENLCDRLIEADPLRVPYYELVKSCRIQFK